VLTVTALQEIPAPPGSAAVRIEVEIGGPPDEEDRTSKDESEPVTESDPVDDALAGAGRVAGGLVAGVGKMIGGVVRAIAPDDDD